MDLGDTNWCLIRFQKPAEVNDESSDLFEVEHISILKEPSGIADDAHTYVDVVFQKCMQDKMAARQRQDDEQPFSKINGFLFQTIGLNDHSHEVLHRIPCLDAEISLVLQSIRAPKNEWVPVARTAYGSRSRCEGD
jgi:hypothetical protein